MDHNIYEMESEANKIRNQISQLNEDNLFGHHSVQGSMFKHSREDEEKEKNSSAQSKKIVKKFKSGKSEKLLRKLELAE